jgi:hypothetical protein
VIYRFGIDFLAAIKIQLSLLITAASLLVLLALALGFLYSPGWILLTLAAAFFFIWGKPKRIDRESTNEKNIYVSNYGKTHLPPPDSWENRAVLDLLRSLVDLSEEKALENRRRQISANLAEEEEALELRRDELDKQIEGVFNDAGEPISRSSSGRDLMSQLGQATPRLLCSLVHKFGKKDVENFDQFIQ